MINDVLNRLRFALAREEGEVTIEWGVLVVFIALALTLVVGVIVGGIETWFENIATWLGGAPSTPPPPAT